MQQGQAGFWALEDRLKELSDRGDPLEALSRAVDFELFRPVLAKAFNRKNPARGGRPGFDPVLKFRMLVLQSLHGLSLEQTEFLVRDQLSWMRFCGLGPGDAVPDANTLWDFREALIKAKLLHGLFFRLDEAIRTAGYLPMRSRMILQKPSRRTGMPTGLSSRKRRAGQKTASPCPGCKSPNMSTRIISALNGSTASSGGSSPQTRRPMTVPGYAKACWTATISARRSGLTVHTDRRRTSAS